MPMLYRIWCRARRNYIDDWEKDTAGSWDAAVKGSSALRASILSQMRDEIAVARGDDTLTVLWDMEKFYDNLYTWHGPAQEWYHSWLFTKHSIC